MFCHIQYERPYPLQFQVFGNFQPDIACANYYGAFDVPCVHDVADLYCILWCPYKKYIFQITPFNGGLNGACAYGNHQLVICMFLFFPSLYILCHYLPGFRVNLHCFRFRQHGNACQLRIFFRRVYNKLVPVFNHMAHIIGKPAACVRNVCALVNHNHFIPTVFPH